MVEIMIVVSTVGLLAAIAIPNFVRSCKRSNTAICISNLRLIDVAVQELRVERPKYPLVEDNIKLFIGRNSVGKMPICPSGGVYRDFDTYVICTFQEPGFEHTVPQ